MALPRNVAFTRTVPMLFSDDLPATIAFYTGRLGFTQTLDWREPDGTPSYIGLTRHTLELHFMAAPPGWTRDQAQQVFVRMTGVAAFYEECRAAGVVHPNGHLGAKPWGLTEFVVLDNMTHGLRFAEETERTTP